MKETDFIEQNKKKWARFEKLGANNNNDPDEVSELFTEITEDLSYARTFYPRRSVRVYLNQLSQGVFTSLYKQQKQPLGNFFKFWTETVPLEMYRAQRNLLVAFLFFVLAALVGAISQHFDVNFVDIILGEGYVDATEERIRDGNPMGIYGESPQGSMFLRITINNIRVAFMAFTGGVLFTLGTYWVMLQNGIMLGAFQWWFNAKGLLLTTFLAIWIHGAFEISAIIIAGAAGLTVGNGIIFPRSYSRIQSLIFASKRGLVIMLSLIPFFIMAGALESFVTRYYQSIPSVIKVIIILGSFTVILFYYVVYPILVAKKHPEKLELTEIPRFIPKRKMVWNKIRKPSETFTDAVTLMMNHFTKLAGIFFRMVLPLSLVMMAVVFILDFKAFKYTVYWYETLGVLFGTGSNFELYKLFGWCVPFAVLLGAAYFIVVDKKDGKDSMSYLKFFIKHFVGLYLYALTVYALFLFSPWVLLVLFLFGGPFLSMILAIYMFEKVNFFNAFSQSFNLGKGGYGDVLISFLSLIGISIIFFFLLHNPMGFGLLTIVDDFLKETLIPVTKDYAVIICIVNTLFYLFYFFLLISLAMFSFMLSYHSVDERKTAKGLFDRLEKFGKRNRNFETDLDFE